MAAMAKSGENKVIMKAMLSASSMKYQQSSIMKMAYESQPAENGAMVAA
jgi:hypothetical protein